MTSLYRSSEANVPPKVYNKKLIFYICAAVFAVSFLIYLPTLRYGFVWDDHSAIRAGTWGGVGLDVYKGEGRYFRPFTPLLYKIEAIMWHAKPIGYHLTNIILNSLACTLCFGLGFMLLESLPAALAAAALFILHPSHADSVAWVSGRTDIIAAIFFFLAFLSYIVFRRDRRYTALVLSCLFMLLSLFGKEIAVVFPLVALAFDRLIRRETARSLFYPQIFFASTIGVYALMRGGINIGTSVAAGGPSTPHAAAVSGTLLRHITEIVYNFGYYVSKLLVPYPLTLFPDAHIPTNLMIAGLFIGLLAIALILRFRMFAFALLFFLLTLAPSFLTVLARQIPVTVAVRYLYLPVFGLSLLAGHVIRNVHWKKAAVPLVILAVLFGTGLYERCSAWKDDFSIFSYEIRNNPDSVIARGQYAMALAKTGRGDLAEKKIDELILDFDNLRCRAEVRRNFWCGLHVAKGMMRSNKGDLDAGEANIQAALAMCPGTKGANALLAGIELQRYEAGNDPASLKKAHALYLKEASLSPGNMNTFLALGRTSFLLGRREEALKYFSEAAEIAPESPTALAAMQEIYKIRFMSRLPRGD